MCDEQPRGWREHDAKTNDADASALLFAILTVIVDVFVVVALVGAAIVRSPPIALSAWFPDIRWTQPVLVDGNGVVKQRATGGELTLAELTTGIKAVVG